LPAGDKSTLQPLLDDEVYQGFVQAIDDRNAAGETVDFTFIGLDKSDIVEAELAGSIAQITMRFKSQLISVTKDSDGRVIDGDPTEVTEMTDIWTFARDTGSGDPNWKLVATEAT
jgi:predicted lipid-binding transport protein (Tim44 family)